MLSHRYSRTKTKYSRNTSGLETNRLWNPTTTATRSSQPRKFRDQVQCSLGVDVDAAVVDAALDLVGVAMREGVVAVEGRHAEGVVAPVVAENSETER